jgi:hypothetical protein
MAIAGLRGTGDWGTDERPKNFREMILWLNPNGTAPIFALSSRAPKETTDDPEFAWWAEPNDQIRLVVNGALGSTDTTVVVQGTDPSSSSLGVNYGSALNLKPGDILLVEPTAETSSFTHELLLVTQAGSSATQFGVQRGFAGSSAASISDTSNLLLIGSAYAEGTTSPQATSRNPVKYFNYTQIFKNAYSVTNTAAQTRARTGDPVKNDKKRQAFNHAAAIEYAMIFGRKNETTGSNGKPLRTMDGLRRLVGNVTVWTSATKTLNDLLDAVSPVFNYDSDAGDTRFAFCGNGALNKINKAIANASGQAALNLNFAGGTKVYGVNFEELVFPQGRILLRTHPLFNRNTLFTNSMLVMDFSAFKWRPLRNRDTKFKDNVQTEREDLQEGFWLTEAGIELDHGGLTCGWIGGFNNM